MATSPAMNTDNQFIKYTISIVQNSQSVENNTSNVTVSVRFYRTNTGYVTYGHGTVYCKINGVTYSAAVTTSQQITSSGIVLLTKTLNIPHNADGSKTLTCSAWINHSRVTSTEQSYSQTLTTIPRATTPSMPAATMGSSVTITLPRASSGFTHTLSYVFGSASGTITTGAGTSYAWAVPIGLASQVPAATSGSGTLTCKTYNGSALIGTVSIPFTANVPASVAPSISSLSVSEATAGLATKFAAYVQGKSKLAIAITAAGSYGSTIARCITTVLGQTYSGTSLTTEAITASGSLTVSTTVTDTRGRTATRTQTITVLPYTAPVLSVANAWRINTSGSAADDGSRIAVQAAYSISDVGGRNDHTYSYAYKRTGDSSFTEFASGSAPWSYNATQAFTSAPEISTDYAYTIRVQVADYFGTVTREISIPTAFTLMDFRGTGHGMAIGKVSEKDALEVALLTELSGGVSMPRIRESTAATAKAEIDALAADMGLLSRLFFSIESDGLLGSGSTFFCELDKNIDGYYSVRGHSYDPNLPGFTMRKAGGTLSDPVWDSQLAYRTARATVSAASSADTDVLSISLPRGYKYVLIGHIQINAADPNAQLHASFNGATFNVISRATAGSGGGVVTWAFADTTDAAMTVRLRGYHTHTSAANMTGSAMILQCAGMPEF